MERIGGDEGPQRIRRSSPYRRGRQKNHHRQPEFLQYNTMPTGAPEGLPTNQANEYSRGTSSTDDRRQHYRRPERVFHADVNQVTSLKSDLGFSTGLAKALAANKNAFLYRIWVVDNSGSMEIGDGHRIVQLADGKIKGQPVTRWEELQDAVTYHSQIAAILHSPSIFTFMNDPGSDIGSQQFSVAVNNRSHVDDEMRKARILMQRVKPAGVTPLTRHVQKIQQTIAKIAPRLRKEEKRVAVILATDGLPTDDEGYGGEEIREEFVHALRALEGLPVWLVIRLCTDEQEVTQFYNELDSRLDLPLEVLDDLEGEAREVHKVNKWLNYALPIHRCRELGHQDRLFDLLDERPLTKGELREFCSLLFGTDVEEIPDPITDWKEFLEYIQDSLKLESELWDPYRKKAGPWIQLKVLHKIYGKGNCTIM